MDDPRIDEQIAHRLLQSGGYPVGWDISGLMASQRGALVEHVVGRGPTAMHELHGVSRAAMDAAQRAYREGNFLEGNRIIAQASREAQTADYRRAITTASDALSAQTGGQMRLRMADQFVSIAGSGQYGEVLGNIDLVTNNKSIRITVPLEAAPGVAFSGRGTRVGNWQMHASGVRPDVRIRGVGGDFALRKFSHSIQSNTGSIWTRQSLSQTGAFNLLFMTQGRKSLLALGREEFGYGPMDEGGAQLGAGVYTEAIGNTPASVRPAKISDVVRIGRTGVFVEPDAGPGTINLFKSTGRVMKAIGRTGQADWAEKVAREIELGLRTHEAMGHDIGADKYLGSELVFDKMRRFQLLDAMTGFKPKHYGRDYGTFIPAINEHMAAFGGKVGNIRDVANLADQSLIRGGMPREGFSAYESRAALRSGTIGGIGIASSGAIAKQSGALGSDEEAAYQLAMGAETADTRFAISPMKNPHSKNEAMADLVSGRLPGATHLTQPIYVPYSATLDPREYSSIHRSSLPVFAFLDPDNVLKESAGIRDTSGIVSSHGQRTLGYNLTESSTVFRDELVDQVIKQLDAKEVAHIRSGLMVARGMQDSAARNMAINNLMFQLNPNIPGFKGILLSGASLGDEILLGYISKDISGGAGVFSTKPISMEAPRTGQLFFKGFSASRYAGMSQYSPIVESTAYGINKISINTGHMTPSVKGSVLHVAGGNMSTVAHKMMGKSTPWGMIVEGVGSSASAANVLNESAGRVAASIGMTSSAFAEAGDRMGLARSMRAMAISAWQSGWQMSAHTKFDRSRGFSSAGIFKAEPMHGLTHLNFGTPQERATSWAAIKAASNIMVDEFQAAGLSPYKEGSLPVAFTLSDKSSSLSAGQYYDAFANRLDSASRRRALRSGSSPATRDARYLYMSPRNMQAGLGPIGEGTERTAMTVMPLAVDKPFYGKMSMNERTFSMMQASIAVKQMAHLGANLPGGPGELTTRDFKEFYSDLLESGKLNVNKEDIATISAMNFHYNRKDFGVMKAYDRMYLEGTQEGRFVVNAMDLVNDPELLRIGDLITESDIDRSIFGWAGQQKVLAKSGFIDHLKLSGKAIPDGVKAMTGVVVSVDPNQVSSGLKAMVSDPTNLYKSAEQKVRAMVLSAQARGSALVPKNMAPEAMEGLVKNYTQATVDLVQRSLDDKFFEVMGAKLATAVRTEGGMRLSGFSAGSTGHALPLLDIFIPRVGIGRRVEDFGFEETPTGIRMKKGVSKTLDLLQQFSGMQDSVLDKAARWLGSIPNIPAAMAIGGTQGIAESDLLPYTLTGISTHSINTEGMSTFLMSKGSMAGTSTIYSLSQAGPIVKARPVMTQGSESKLFSAIGMPTTTKEEISAAGAFGNIARKLKLSLARSIQFSDPTSAIEEMESLLQELETASPGASEVIKRKIKHLSEKSRYGSKGREMSKLMQFTSPDDFGGIVGSVMDTHREMIGFAGAAITEGTEKAFMKASVTGGGSMHLMAAAGLTSNIFSHAEENLASQFKEAGVSRIKYGFLDEVAGEPLKHFAQVHVTGQDAKILLSSSVRKSLEISGKNPQEIIEMMNSSVGQNLSFTQLSFRDPVFAGSQATGVETMLRPGIAPGTVKVSTVYQSTFALGDFDSDMATLVSAISDRIRELGGANSKNKVALSIHLAMKSVLDTAGGTLAFGSDKATLAAADQLTALLGRRVDPKTKAISPMVDVELFPGMPKIRMSRERVRGVMAGQSEMLESFFPSAGLSNAMAYTEQGTTPFLMGIANATVGPVRKFSQRLNNGIASFLSMVPGSDSAHMAALGRLSRATQGLMSQFGSALSESKIGAKHGTIPVIAELASLMRFATTGVKILGQESGEEDLRMMRGIARRLSEMSSTDTNAKNLLAFLGDGGEQSQFNRLAGLVGGAFELGGMSRERATGVISRFHGQLEGIASGSPGIGDRETLEQVGYYLDRYGLRVSGERIVMSTNKLMDVLRTGETYLMKREVGSTVSRLGEFDAAVMKAGGGAHGFSPLTTHGGFSEQIAALEGYFKQDFFKSGGGFYSSGIADSMRGSGLDLFYNRKSWVMGQLIKKMLPISTMKMEKVGSEFVTTERYDKNMVGQIRYGVSGNEFMDLLTTKENMESIVAKVSNGDTGLAEKLFRTLQNESGASGATIAEFADNISGNGDARSRAAGYLFSVILGEGAKDKGARATWDDGSLSGAVREFHDVDDDLGKKINAYRAGFDQGINHEWTQAAAEHTMAHENDLVTSSRRFKGVMSREELLSRLQRGQMSLGADDVEHLAEAGYDRAELEALVPGHNAEAQARAEYARNLYGDSVPDEIMKHDMFQVQYDDSGKVHRVSPVSPLDVSGGEVPRLSPDLETGLGKLLSGTGLESYLRKNYQGAEIESAARTAASISSDVIQSLATRAEGRSASLASQLLSKGRSGVAGFLALGVVAVSSMLGSSAHANIPKMASSGVADAIAQSSVARQAMSMVEDPISLVTRGMGHIDPLMSSAGRTSSGIDQTTLGQMALQNPMPPPPSGGMSAKLIMGGPDTGGGAYHIRSRGDIRHQRSSMTSAVTSIEIAGFRPQGNVSFTDSGSSYFRRRRLAEGLDNAY